MHFENNITNHDFVQCLKFVTFCVLFSKLKVSELSVFSKISECSLVLAFKLVADLGRLHSRICLFPHSKWLQLQQQLVEKLSLEPSILVDEIFARSSLDHQISSSL